MTPYQKHKELNHKMGRYSPNGIDIIEECDTCGARFLWHPGDEYAPISLRYKVIADTTKQKVNQ